MFTWISSSNTGRGAAASTRAEEQQQHGLAPPAAGEKQRRNRAAAGTWAEEKEQHGSRWELDEDLREIEEDARKLLSTGLWRPVPAMPVGDHGGRGRGGTREAAQGGLAAARGGLAVARGR
uniref:Uncharacterized protein n=1 Tax=Aegilops tauschii subsp. strangulata TaxID=200361 RepID=A0A452ZLV4_AEGTS